LLFLTSCFSRQKAIKEKPVLTVNGTEISSEQFAQKLARQLRDYDALQAKDEANLERAKRQTEQSLIFEVLLRDFSAKNQLSVSKTEVEAEVDKIRSRYPDDAAFRRALAEQNLPLDAWKSGIEFSLLQKKIVEKLMVDAERPSEDELKKYYEANKREFERPARIQLRQIVLSNEEHAKRILDELSAGKNFAELAKKFSVAPEGENGGVTGWIEKGTLDVFDQAFRLNVGARSKIIKSPYGWQIYEVLKKEPEGRLNFEQAKDKIRALLNEQREQKVFSAWLEKEVRQAKVLRNEALIRAIQVTTRGT